MMGEFLPNTTENDDIFARPPRRSIPLPPRQTCAVCGLRSDAIVCEMCNQHTAASIVWLEKLPALSKTEQQALALLRQPARENYFDGEWRPVTDLSYTAMEKLRSRGFVLGSDRYGKLMARWPIAPAAPLRTIIAGSRTITDMAVVEYAVQKSGFEITEVVSGGAKGVDTLAQQFAEYHNIPVKVFMADWNAHGKSAGPIRNQQMAEYADQLIAVWDGVSLGTCHMIDCANRRGIRVSVTTFAPITFTGIPLDYWREEARLGCAVSLARLRRICQDRNADYEKTVAGLR